MAVWKREPSAHSASLRQIKRAHLRLYLFILLDQIMRQFASCASLNAGKREWNGIALELVFCFRCCIDKKMKPTFLPFLFPFLLSHLQLRSGPVLLGVDKSLYKMSLGMKTLKSTWKEIESGGAECKRFDDQGHRLSRETKTRYYSPLLHSRFFSHPSFSSLFTHSILFILTFPLLFPGVFLLLNLQNDSW